MCCVYNLMEPETRNKYRIGDCNTKSFEYHVLRKLIIQLSSFENDITGDAIIGRHRVPYLRGRDLDKLSVKLISKYQTDSVVGLVKQTKIHKVCSPTHSARSIKVSFSDHLTCSRRR